MISFVREGLRSSLEEIFPISDFTGNLELDFWGYELGEPKYDERESKERDVSYQAPMKLKVRLTNKETGELKESEVYLGELPVISLDRKSVV